MIIGQHELGARIKRLREKNGWSQKDLAEYAGLHFNTVYKAENGIITITMDTLNRLAVVFGMEPYELIW